MRDNSKQSRKKFGFHISEHSKGRVSITHADLDYVVAAADSELNVYLNEAQRYINEYFQHLSGAGASKDPKSLFKIQSGLARHAIHDSPMSNIAAFAEILSSIGSASTRRRMNRLIKNL